VSPFFNCASGEQISLRAPTATAFLITTLGTQPHGTDITASSILNLLEASPEASFASLREHTLQSQSRGWPTIGDLAWTRHKPSTSPINPHTNVLGFGHRDQHYSKERPLYASLLEHFLESGTCLESFGGHPRHWPSPEATIKGDRRDHEYWEQVSEGIFLKTPLDPVHSGQSALAPFTTCPPGN
jgi:hypothetical protein